MLSKQETERLIQEWVDKGLLKKGKTNEGLAKALGVEQPRISEMRNGRRRVQAAELPIIAQYLGEPVPPELVPAAGQFHRIKVVGIVQAGYWAEPNEDRVPQNEYVEAPLAEPYHGLNLKGLRVQGDSMNLVYPEGTVLICSSLYDLHEDEPIAGKRYIVRRTRADGAVEMTVKEAMADATGKWWLWPRSSNPYHQEPIPFDVQEGDTIEVTARVLYSMRPE
jgi:transcriptional regulator with XRE-family HTH domain